MIEQIRMINCQSWEDQTITLASDRVNVIKAPNSTGKSVLFKLLRVAICKDATPKHKRRQLIRVGASHAEFITSFVDGAIGMTVIYPNDVIYRYTPSRNEPFVTYNEPPKEYIDNLGIVTNSNGFVANIIDKNQDLLLVDSDTRGNEEFMKLLTENKDLMESQENTKLKVGYYKNKLSELQFSIMSVNNLIDKIQVVDTVKLEESINKAQDCYSALQSMMSLLGYIKNLSYVKKDSTDYDYILSLLDTLQFIMSLQNNLTLTEKFNEDAIHKFDGTLLLLELQNMLSSIKVVDEVSDDFLTLVNLLKPLQDNIEILEKPVVNYDERADSYLDTLSALHDILNYLDTAKDASVKAEHANSEIIKCYEELAKNTTKYECPIYGEVMYNGKECVPCDI